MKDIITCVLGTLGFSVLLKVPKRLLFASTFGGLISSATFYWMNSVLQSDTFLSVLVAMIFISAYAQIIARLKRTPATVILFPSTIPLLPGSSVYYAMYAVVSENKSDFSFYAMETIKTATGIALGAVIVAMIIKLIQNIKKEYFVH